MSESGGSGETARMRRLAWNFAARIGDKYQIRLTRPICTVIWVTIMRLFLVKVVDCVKEVIKLNRWQILAGVTDVKMSSFGQMYNDLWVLRFNEQSYSKRKR